MVLSWFKSSYLFTFGCAGSSLLCQLFSSRGKQGQLSSCGVQTYCSGFSCWRTRARGQPVAHGLSSCGPQVLEHSLNRCGTQPWFLWGVWDLLRTGIEPVSPALADGFFATEPPGKPCIITLSSPKDTKLRELRHL